MPSRSLRDAAPFSRRRMLAGAAGLALVTRHSSAAQGVGTPEAGLAGAWTFTDDTGQTITLPARPERVVAYLPIAAGLWDFGVRPIAVYGTTTRPDGSPEVFVGNVDLDTVATLGQEYGEIDLERLVSLDPDLVVNDNWFAELDVWGLPAEAVAQIESLAPIAHIRFVERPVTTIIERMGELAAALGADLAAPEVVATRDAFTRAETAVRAAIAEKPGLTAAFVGPTADGFYVGNPAQMADLTYFKELGLDVVTPESTELWQMLSWEEAGRYPADLLFVDARSFSLSPEELAEIATWNALPAVQAGQVAPWQIEFIPSYAALTTVLEEVTAAIRDADAGIVG